MKRLIILSIVLITSFSAVLKAEPEQYVMRTETKFFAGDKADIDYAVKEYVKQKRMQTHKDVVAIHRGWNENGHAVYTFQYYEKYNALAGFKNYAY